MTHPNYTDNMNSAIASREERPSILRIKRKTRDAGESRIILEAFTDRGLDPNQGLFQHDVALSAQLENLGLSGGSAKAGSQKKRRLCQRVCEIGVSDLLEHNTDQMSQTIQSYMSELHTAQNVTQLSQDDGGLPAMTSKAEPRRAITKRDRGIVPTNVEYHQVFKHVKELDGDVVKPDPLQSAFRVYDFEVSEAAGRTSDMPESKGEDWQQQDYVYDIYVIQDYENDLLEKTDAPVLQVEHWLENDFISNAVSRSSFDSEDSNDQDFYANDYPDDEYDCSSDDAGIHNYRVGGYSDNYEFGNFDVDFEGCHKFASAYHHDSDSSYDAGDENYDD